MPVRGRYPIVVSSADRARVAKLADELREHYPQLAADQRWSEFVPKHLDSTPALHLEEWTEIQLVCGRDAALAAQDRPRCRATEGDCVATCVEIDESYEIYCRQRLGLGAVEWLRAKAPRDPIHLAEACWEDRSIRRRLVHLIRERKIGYLHPHMGSLASWELALLLSTASHHAIQVIAPPPEVTRLLNDKAEFAHIVHRLLGHRITPKTFAVWDRAHAALRIRQLVTDYSRIGVKLPSSAGGDGNLLLASDLFRGQALNTVADELRPLLSQLDWEDGEKLLVSGWESLVMATPSCQTWIPPLADGDPLLEGVFQQRIEGTQSTFVGCRISELPKEITDQVVNNCFLIALLLQQLGYVGRCSFDLILVGSSPESSKLKFIECNARWGGTSLPMTIMTQIFGDWSQIPFTVSVCGNPKLKELTWSQICDALDPYLYDQTTGRGHYILYNPSRLSDGGRVGVIATADNAVMADYRALTEFPRLLEQL
jgi:hypothetical protein